MHSIGGVAISITLAAKMMGIPPPRETWHYAQDAIMLHGTCISSRTDKLRVIE